MQKEELPEFLSHWENLSLMFDKVENYDEYFPLLMDFALYSNHKMDWRAAWVTDKMHEKETWRVVPYLPKIIEQLGNIDHPGKKRQFLKLISLHTIPSQYKSFLLDYCLKNFKNAMEPTAVRVYAMQILFNISESLPEIKNEIQEVISNELEKHATAGLLARGKKIMAKLQRQLNSKATKKNTSGGIQ